MVAFALLMIALALSVALAATEARPLLATPARPVSPPDETVSVALAALVNTFAPMTFPVTVNVAPLLFRIALSNVPPLAAIVPVLITAAVTVALACPRW